MEFTPDVFPDMPHLKGPMLVGFVLTSILYGCNLGALGAYIQFSWATDRKAIRILVVIVSVVATASMILSLSNIIRQFGVQFGKAPTKLDSQLMSCNYPIQACMHILVAGYFARRAWKMYNRPLWMAFSLGTLMTATAAGTSGSWILGLTTGAGTQTKAETILILMMIVTQVAADAIIFVLIITKFATSKTGFKQTDSLMRNLIFVGIETQAPPAFFAVAFLIVFLVSKHQAYSFAFTCFPMVYAMSLFAALNSRHKILSKMQNEVSIEWGGDPRSRRTLPMNSINVHTETYTHAHAADHLDNRSKPIRGAGTCAESTDSFQDHEQDTKDLNTSEIRLVQALSA